MTVQTQSRGSVVAVEFNDFVELWEFPLTVSSQNRGYERGTKLDWRSSLIRRTKSFNSEGFLREV
jgi:hypothetical protein